MTIILQDDVMEDWISPETAVEGAKMLLVRIPGLRDELFNGEIFYSLKEAQIIIEDWRYHYNTKRPHSSLGYKPSAPESIIHLHERIPMN